MRKTLICLFIVCLNTASLSAQTFEGTFVMHIQDDNSVSMMNVFVHKDKVIFQPIDPTVPKPFNILLSKNSNDIFVLFEENGKKIAIKHTFIPPPDFSPINMDVPYNPEDSLVPPPPINVKETGNKKTLEGFVCKEVFINDVSGKNYQLWVTPEVGFTMTQFYDYLGKFSAAVNGGDYEEIVRYNTTSVYKNNMALEMKEVKEKDATVILIKKIVKKSLPEADFTTDGYLIVDVKDLPAPK